MHKIQNDNYCLHIDECWFPDHKHHLVLVYKHRLRHNISDKKPLGWTNTKYCLHHMYMPYRLLYPMLFDNNHLFLLYLHQMYIRTDNLFHSHCLHHNIQLYQNNIFQQDRLHMNALCHYSMYLTDNLANNAL